MFNKLQNRNENHSNYFYQNAAQEVKVLNVDQENNEAKIRSYQILCLQSNKQNSFQLISNQQLF